MQALYAPGRRVSPVKLYQYQMLRDRRIIGIMVGLILAYVAVGVLVVAVRQVAVDVWGWFAGG